MQNWNKIKSLRAVGRLVLSTSLVVTLIGCKTTESAGPLSGKAVAPGVSESLCKATQAVDVVRRNPAPPLTGIGTIKVASETQPEGECIGPNQFFTRLKHGGKWLVIVTYELGYGQNEHARLNGRKGKLLKKESIGGPIVKDWLLYYEFKPCSGGKFDFSATGMNGGVPLSTTFQIRGSK